MVFLVFNAAASTVSNQGTNTMRKVLFSLAALSAVAVAAPAMAQPYGHAYGHQRGYDSRAWVPIEARLDRLYTRIERGVESGRLTRREAQGLRYEFRDLVQRERVYSRNGLSWQERADLDARLDRLAQRVRFERRDGEDRYDRRGYDDRGYDRRDGYRGDDRRGY